MGPRKTKVVLAILLTIAAALSLILGVTLGAHAHVHTYDASLSIAYRQNKDLFHGHLSTGAPCQPRRIISVFQVRPGPDRRAGKDHTDPTGDYDVENTAGLTGKFYARTGLVTRGDGYFHRHRCEGARSQPVEVSAP